MAYFKEVLPNSHGKWRPHVDVEWCKSHDVSKVSISKTGFRPDLSPTKRGLPVPWKGHSKDLVGHDGKALTQRPDQDKIAAEILKLLYFEWSPPWHVGWRLSGEGCHWEYDGKNREFENIDFRFPWLSDTSEMGFGHDVPFLNYSDRLPHPSDLCQPDRVRWG